MFSANEQEHEQHCLKIFHRLKEAGLYLDIEKCEFSVQRVTYLGMILSTDGLEMDPAKVQAVMDWQEP